MITHSRYIGDLLKIFYMQDCKAPPFPFLFGIRLEEGGSTPLIDNTLYIELIGMLFYFNHSIPDLSYVFSVVSRFIQEPHELHWRETKHVVHYVYSTTEFCIHDSTGAQLYLVGFTDSEWDGENTYKKIAMGFFSWCNQDQFSSQARINYSLHSLQPKQSIARL